MWGVYARYGRVSNFCKARVAMPILLKHKSRAQILIDKGSRYDGDPLCTKMQEQARELISAYRDSLPIARLALLVEAIKRGDVIGVGLAGLRAGIDERLQHAVGVVSVTHSGQ